MEAITIIVMKMLACLLVMLFLGLLFGYMYAKAKMKEYYEDKMDALQELGEAKAKRLEAANAKYGNLEIEYKRLKNRWVDHEKEIEGYVAKERQHIAKMEKLKNENEEINNYMKNLEKDISQKEEEIISLRERLEQFEKDRQSIRSELEKTNYELENLKEKDEKEKELIQKLQSDLVEKEEHIKKATDAMLQLQQKVDLLAAEKETFEKDARQLKNIIEERDDYVMQTKNLIEEKDGYLARTKELMQKLEILEKEKGLLALKVDELKNRLTNNEKKRNGEELDKEIANSLKEIKTHLSQNRIELSDEARVEILKEIEQFEERMEKESEKKSLLGFAKNILAKLKK